MERTGTVVEGLDSQQNACKIDDRVGNLKFSCRDWCDVLHYVNYVVSNVVIFVEVE